MSDAPQKTPVTSRPPVLRPPQSGSGQDNPKNSFNSIIVVVLLVCLLGAAVFLINFQPHQKTALLQAPPTAAPQHPPPQTDPPILESNGLPNPENLKAEKMLEDWLKIQAKMEAENVAVWGGAMYESALALSAHGDTLFKENKFLAAQDAYQNALKILIKLESDKENIFQQAMEHGTAALAANKSQEATKAFQLALAVQPLNQTAEEQLRRAQNLDQVLKLYELGKLREAADDLIAAKQYYHESASLDPFFIPAGSALQSVDNKLADIYFQETISLFLEALNDNNIFLAQTELNKAALLRPGDPAVINGQKQLETAIISQKLLALQKKAEKLSSGEQWQEVIQTCKQALAILPSAGFALECLERGNHLLDLNNKISAIVSQPTRLQTDDVLSNAEQTLAWARSISDPGPLLLQKIAQLAKLIAKAKISVSVTLHSDNLTEVVIYHIGRFGRFQQKQLALRPGVYTIVGSRPGFRDVRIQLQVDPDQASTSVTIRCEEAI
jgi:tetratricopeptide (TPR) repeat protein